VNAPLGTLDVAQAQTVTVTLKPVQKPGVAVMNFRALELRPMP
jgi:hypothetical protein